MRAGAAALALAAIGAAGCGAGGSRATVTVSAAASLREALGACSGQVPGVRLRVQTGGSDQLAAQIRAGVRPDLFASADTALPESLARAGIAQAPQRFATNELVLAVSSTDGRLRTFAELLARPPTIAVGSAGVPVGAYTQRALARLPPDRRRAVEEHVRTREPDVKGIVGKLVTGAVGAGFVYASDVRAAGGRLRAIRLPAALRPRVAYAAAIIRGTSVPDAARRVLASLRDGACQRALRRAGFGPPPG